ncbi:MAG: type I methionyl aminopeptidase [Candidatus Falkowbacteria bacterium]|nr:type I methionyl aminopeptidase [Candidatus Falkowbacteria bacterium]
MVKIKNKEEIKIMREGGQKLARILDEVAKAVKPGVTTEELEKIAMRLIKTAGGRPSFKGLAMYNRKRFPTALCTSINDEIVHAPAFPARVLKAGDIIGIDVGMEYPLTSKKTSQEYNRYSKRGGYFTDMAITLPVGEVCADIKKLISTTKQSLYLGIKEARAGKKLGNIGKAIQKFVESQGYAVVRELVGHGVGHEVHEEPQVLNYAVKNGGEDDIELKPGMVLAIEPMVNIGSWHALAAPDGFTIVTKDGKLSVHFEHTVAVTEDGPIVLTAL